MTTETPNMADRISALEAENARLRKALERADKLIDFMSEYVGGMAPGDYANFYADLNEHFLDVETRAALQPALEPK